MRTIINNNNYRPDIDGLRALAVLAVISFHAYESSITGGFIGVDIFFVISGYLISLIIYKHLANDTFNFLEFYARRIKRIFPSLLIILAACFAFGWFILLSDEYAQLGKHIAGGAGFISNFLLWSESGYFDDSSDTKPLLHLWSLGIEEQFYILWPLILWLAWKLKLNILIIIITVTISSFFVNMIGIKFDSVATFYSPLTRFWELSKGSLLAWIIMYKKNELIKIKYKINNQLAFYFFPRKKIHSETFNNTLSLIGLLILMYGFWGINDELSYPGKWVLIPVIGSALIILAGPKAWVNRAILSNNIAIWFGLISYPLFLWHWPILSFARIIEGGVISPSIKIYSIFFSILLAWLTYKFVEYPLRFGDHSKVKVAALIILMTLIACIGFNTFSQSGFGFRSVNSLNAIINSDADGGHGGNIINECGIKNESVRKLFAICAMDKRDSVRFALMGDSKAAALYKGLIRTSQINGRWLVIGGFGVSGAPIPLLSAYPDPDRPLTNSAIEAILDNNNIETVVLVTAIRALFGLSANQKHGNSLIYNHDYLNTLASSKRFNETFSDLNRVVSTFINNSKKVIIVVDNPALPDAKDCISRVTSLEFINQIYNLKHKDCSIPLDDFNRQIEIYRKLLDKIQALYPNSVEIFDPTDVYCDSNTKKCSVIKNGRLIYAYTDHISDYAAGLVGHKLNEFINSKK